MKIIDLETWNRKQLYENFGSFTNPCVAVDVRLDVTKLVRLKKKTGGFFVPFLYILMRAVNETKEARLRVKGENVIELDRTDPSFTVLFEDNNFGFCYSVFDYDYSVFAKNTTSAINETIENYKKGIVNQTNHEDSYQKTYISCTPWYDILSVSNPIPYESKELLSIPRLNWGKYVKEGFKYKMTLSLTFSHALIDGYQIGLVIKSIEKMLKEPSKYLKV